MIGRMGKPKIQTLKGFRDFLPEEAIKRQWLEKKIRQVFELWGYDPLETPTLEPLELFEGQIGEGEKLFYKFEDAGGRKVALRYDQTVPAARVVGQYSQQLPMPFRRYQIQSAFRAEKPQRGRYREFLQADADIFGVVSPLADAEVVALSLDIFRQLGFKQAKVLVNDRKLLAGLPYPAVAAIDKLKKVGEGGVIREMGRKSISKAKAKEYLAYVRKLESSEAVRFILDYLAKMGFEQEWYEFSPTLVRSFAYSTGPIWEVEIPGFEAGSVLGGERYDELVRQIAGMEVAGTGFGLGFDRTLEAAEQLGLVPQMATTTKVLVTIFALDLVDMAVGVARKLREAGVNTELYPNEEVKLDKQLKYADKKGVPYVVIVGPEEKEKGLVKVKEMKTGKQETVKFAQLIERLRPLG